MISNTIERDHRTFFAEFMNTQFGTRIKITDIENEATFGGVVSAYHQDDLNQIAGVMVDAYEAGMNARRGEVAKMFGLDPEAVRVIAKHIGGKHD